MAAGTEVTQPVSAINTALQKDMPLDTCFKGTENGTGENDSECQSKKTGNLNFGYLGPTKVEHNTSMAYKKVESCCSLPPLAEFKPTIRSGVCSDRGVRTSMEDEHICIDDLTEHIGTLVAGKGPKCCYGVFDGHGGIYAAQFVRNNLLQYILKDAAFPLRVQDALHLGFLATDRAFAEACSLDENLSSGTTALMVLLLGRKLYIANAGDCRAVLCRRGKAINLSTDHKPSCLEEKLRIEANQGYIDDGYLNGLLGVTRAIGNWHMEGLKGEGCPLSAEPEIKELILSEEDEFLIIGCDGIWDVLPSQLAVDFARKRLQQHNDPQKCCRELVDEALQRQSIDNLTVVVVCFQNVPPPQPVGKFRVRKSISSQGLRSLQGALDGLY